MMQRFSGGTPEGRAAVISQEPIGRMGTPEEIAAAVLWLCSDAASFATGHAMVVDSTDALIRLPLTCVCGSDLWPYRGIEPIDGPTPMGHEYVGIVEEVGSEVRLIEPGQFVVGSFFASDNTCEICRAGYQSSCIHRQPGAPTGAQAQYARIPLADGTLVATPHLPPEEVSPSRRAASAGLGAVCCGPVAGGAAPGKRARVVGDVAVRRLAVLRAE